ncbi:MAG TPA: endonuclease/exonuclease/phosphatase family protein [Actinophytocola sp.]|uniref:endonuclease/exonuclease/phosphatase family protein n=1 Tax=Actinophytocola sp. TaxID=1872138 RepID=UPI002DBAECF6|nr:endonuclease/exonuclease/phosphatase family protein [Actinophytocola sp.]HEU5472919.1 endonuclease/exonuclease/phosphatase family protein [Actinophytocola sp.]
MRVGLAAMAVAVGAMMIGAPLDAPAATSTVKVLQLNICHSGVAGCYTGERVMTKAISVISSTRPQVVSVNEACSGDVERLRAAMGPASTMFVAAQRPAGNPVLCVNGQEYGNIIMVAADLAGGPGVSGRFTAQDSSTEMRAWACLPAGVLSACTTHLSARDSSAAMAQCRELLARAVSYAGTAPTVVAGDFNLRYQGNPNIQNCNPAGFYRKGDGSVQHVFATTSLAFVSTTRIDMSGTTDHPGWLVTVTRG